MSNITRRKFLQITASSLVLPLSFNNLLANSLEKTTWSGSALGAQSNMTLFHTDKSYAKKTLSICIDEVRRLEKIFSLFDLDSSVSLLNTKGFLENPPKELVEVLEFASTISHNTNGAFDVTVQPLWVAHKQFFDNKNKKDINKLKESIEKIKYLVSYKNLSIDKKYISFKQKGMKITLNGIAQGYITDKITNILEHKGFTNVLVDLGEINSIGGYDDKRDWNIATPFLKDRDYITLKNSAVASSAGFGTKFYQHYHHLFDTTTGTSANYIDAVTVEAKNAMLADALSTAIFVMPIVKSEQLKIIYPNIKIYFT